MIALAVLSIVAPEMAHATATSTTGLSTIGNTVCGVYNCIATSTLVTVIATVAIFFLGIGAFFGKVNWGLVIMVALGIAVLLGALAIAATVTGNSNCSGKSLGSAATTC